MLYQNVEHQTGILSDARTYGLPTFLPQQQQQIQQHMLAIPDGQNGSIYVCILFMKNQKMNHHYKHYLR
ncbi:hypothetical protein BLA29_013616 [Euroglyphus maynei]|uniref:Uncharacterized protein n=1 Tax=Euroglyphus maynei TaxID=6958 RepID=A0A1Y3BK08_EURMA|nr:hypothetical protein BLA29_013616 [Euroglyphus maynei]